MAQDGPRVALRWPKTATFGSIFPLVRAGSRKPRARERLLVQNSKSQVASGRLVLRNGLQDGLLWPLLVVYFRWFPLVPASPVHVNGSWYKIANHQ